MIGTMKDKEIKRMHSKIVVWSLILKAKALIRSLSLSRGIHLMDTVIYKGGKYFVNNGVSAPWWDICEKEWNNNMKRVSIRVHEELLKKEFTWRNFKNSTFYYYRWYMSCWYSIDLRKRLE